MAAAPATSSITQFPPNFDKFVSAKLKNSGVADQWTAKDILDSLKTYMQDEKLSLPEAVAQITDAWAKSGNSPLEVNTHALWKKIGEGLPKPKPPLDLAVVKNTIQDVLADHGQISHTPKTLLQLYKTDAKPGQTFSDWAQSYKEFSLKHGQDAPAKFWGDLADAFKGEQVAP